MSSSVGLFGLLSLLARAVWFAAQPTSGQNDCSTIEWALMPDDFMHEALEYAVDSAWEQMSPEDQANYASTKQQLLDLINGVGMDDERLRKTVQLLDGFAPDGSAAKNVLLSQPVYTVWISFSNLCLYLNCAIERGFLAGAKKDCGWVTTTTTTTVATTTTTKASGPQPGSCECSQGQKSFWNSGSSADPLVAIKSSAIYTLQTNCDDLCIIDEAGTECTQTEPNPYVAAAIMPFCTKDRCHMYVQLFNYAGTPLRCGSKNFTWEGQLDTGKYRSMDPDANPQPYVHAAAFTCSGCAAIRDSNCIPPRAGCAGIESLVQADPANNTALTTALNAAWNGWSRSDKANFAAYKKRIENAVYDQTPDMSNGIKTEQVSRILDGYAPDGSAAKDLILAIQIAGWGSLCDYLNCAIRGFYMLGDEKNCDAFTTTTSATTSTSTTSVSSTTTTTTTVSTTTTPADEAGYFCPAGWTYFAYTKSCYMLNRDAPASSFDEQEKACQAMGAHLMSVHRNSEQTLILAILVENFVTSAWIGLHSPTSNLTYVWTDGTAYDYRHWADGFPNATAPNHCVRVTTTDQVKLAPWQNADCAQNLPGVCKKAAMPVGQGSCPPSCEPGWTGFSDGSASRYCAKYVSTNVTYDEALAKCQEQGAALPAVRSEKENAFFLKLAAASAGDPVWLGLKQDEDTLAWSWPDGSDGLAGYTHWAPENPILREPAATCVNLYPSLDGDSTGLWKNEYCRCANCWAGAICVKSVDGTTPTTTTTATAPASCLPLAADEVGLTLSEGTGSDGTTETNVQAECPCTSGVRQFVKSLSSPNTTDALAKWTYYGVRCEDAHSLCICGENGMCCTPTETAPTSIAFMPYCDLAGGTKKECHMFAVQQGDRDSSGMQCTDGISHYMSSQFVSVVGDTLVDLSPTAEYIQAQSVSCEGCTPIMPANEVCTGLAEPLD